MINWDDPEARFRLIERVGVDEYTRLYFEHMRRSTVVTVGGHDIRSINTGRFGWLFVVGDTGRAFSTQAQAETYVKKNPK